MTQASELLDTAQRHLCDIDEIVDRLTVPDETLSESKAASLMAIGNHHLDSVDEILNHLERLAAAQDVRRLADRLLAQSERLRKLADVVWPEGGGT
jgi:hypothetical protein